jgi:putative Holliday junction resolvase
MAKLLGIDFGTQRIGLALTDELMIVGSPWKTVTPKEFWSEIMKYIASENIQGMVMGVARHRDGSESDTTRLQMEFLQRLRKSFPAMIIHTVDERYTSKLATNAIHQLGLSKKKRSDKSLTDMISAALILQFYIDQKKA